MRFSVCGLDLDLTRRHAKEKLDASLIQGIDPGHSIPKDITVEELPRKEDSRRSTPARKRSTKNRGSLSTPAARSIRFIESTPNQHRVDRVLRLGTLKRRNAGPRSAPKSRSRSPSHCLVERWRIRQTDLVACQDGREHDDSVTDEGPGRAPTGLYQLKSLQPARTNPAERHRQVPSDHQPVAT